MAKKIAKNRRRSLSFFFLFFFADDVGVIGRDERLHNHEPNEAAA